MNDLNARYAGFLRDIAAVYPDDEPLREQLRVVSITQEDWDEGRGGGHFKFSTPASAAAVNYYTLDVFADDADGGKIDIILHFVNGLLNWGEWFRFDDEAITRWPPPTLRAQF